MKVTEPVNAARFKPVRKLEWNNLSLEERKLVLKTLAVNKEAIRSKVDSIVRKRN